MTKAVRLAKRVAELQACSRSDAEPVITGVRVAGWPGGRVAGWPGGGVDGSTAS